MVLFQDKLAKVVSMTDSGVWALTPDRPSRSVLSHHSPSLDHMTPLRREVLQGVLADHLGTYDELLSTELVEVSTIDGSFTQTEA